MRRWIEPYKSPVDWETHLWTIGILTVLGAAMLCGLLGGKEGYEYTGFHAGYLVPPAALAVCGWYAWRLTHIGVAVDDHGVRVRTVMWTRILPWADVERAWVGPVTPKAGRGPGRAMWIAARAPGSSRSRQVETLLWLRGTDDRYGIRNAVVLDTSELTHVVNLINQRADSPLPDHPARP